MSKIIFYVFMTVIIVFHKINSFSIRVLNAPLCLLNLTFPSRMKILWFPSMFGMIRLLSADSLTFCELVKP